MSFVCKELSPFLHKGPLPNLWNQIGRKERNPLTKPFFFYLRGQPHQGKGLEGMNIKFNPFYWGSYSSTPEGGTEIGFLGFNVCVGWKKVSRGWGDEFRQLPSKSSSPCGSFYSPHNNGLENAFFPSVSNLTSNNPNPNVHGSVDTSWAFLSLVSKCTCISDRFVPSLQP